MELIFTWVIQAEHTGAFSQNPSFAWIKKKFLQKFATAPGTQCSQKGLFIPTIIAKPLPSSSSKTNLVWD